MQKKLLKTTLPGAEEQVYVSYLEDLGYTVLPPLKDSHKISNAEIIAYFYVRLEMVAGKEFVLATPADKQNDRKALGRFHRRAIKLKLTGQEANASLYKLLALVFKHYERLGLQTHPDSLECLLAASRSWILRKAVSLDEYHKKYGYEMSEEFNAKLDIMCERPSEEFERMKSIRQKAIMNTRETQYGQED